MTGAVLWKELTRLFKRNWDWGSLDHVNNNNNNNSYTKISIYYYCSHIKKSVSSISYNKKD